MATTTKTAAKKTATKKTQSKTAEQKVAFADMMSFADTSEWSTAAKEQFETLMSSFGGNVEDMRAHAEEFSEEFQARMTATQERAAETNARLMEVAQEEVSSTVQLANDLTNAKSFADALTIQQSYWTKLFETRMTNAREMTEASVEAAKETFTPVEMPFANMNGFEKFFAFPAKA